MRSEDLEKLIMRIERLPALPLWLPELLFYWFPGNIQWWNPFCNNSLLNFSNKNNEYCSPLSKIIHSPISTSTQLNNKFFLDEQTFIKKRENVLSSSLNNIGKISNAVKAVGKEATAGKNINFN